MKKYIISIILIGIIIATILVNNMVKVKEKTFTQFEDSGYILQSKEIDEDTMQRYYFADLQKYKENYNKEIVFKDINGIKVVSHNNNFVHYANGSISAFKNGVLIDLVNIADNPIFYYNIEKKKTLRKKGDNYSIKNLNQELNFKYPLWKIDNNKYLLAGNGIKAVLADGTQKDIGSYIEIEYCDNNVIKLYDEEIMYQTIADGTTIKIPGDIELDLAKKIAKIKNKNQMSFENMVIDSDDNIKIVDIDETEEKETQENKEGKDNSKNNNNTNNNTNNNINSGTTNNSQTTQIEEPTAKNVTIPKFTTSNFEVSKIGMNTKISIDDPENLLNEKTNIKIIKKDSGKVIQESSYEIGELEILLEVNTLIPDTDYILQVSSAYDIDGIKYKKNFIYKNFKTHTIGVDYEKDAFTNKSMNFEVKFDSNSNIVKANLLLFTEDGQEIANEEVVNKDIIKGSKAIVTFTELNPNTKYNLVLTDVLYDGQIITDRFRNEKQFTTLKNLPIISGTEYEIDKRNSKFVLKLKDVQDEHRGIVKYKFLVYDTRISEENQKPIEIIETDKKEIELPISDKIVRNVAYTYKVVALFDDNEKICEYASEYSNPMKMDGAQFPLVNFEEEKITYERINGALVIEDKDKTINLTEDTIFKVVYTDSVGKTKTFTTQGSLRIPIDVNNLRANETYKFGIYGKVDLRDGNPPIDECYIGGAIIKTKEPENMVAEFKQNDKDTKNTFSVKLQLKPENINSADLEAKTLTGIKFSIYSGATPEGEKPQGTLQKTIKMVDKNEKPYESELKDKMYDTPIEITPKLFNLSNSDFKEKFYTIVVTDAYDYTEYQNALPILNKTFVVKTNGYMPELPQDPNDAINVKSIRNYESENPDSNLDKSTIVGYDIQANYDNVGKYAKKVIYKAIHTTTGEIIETHELNVKQDGIIPRCVFAVKEGTKVGVIDKDALRRGNSYYFTYEVALDLNSDGEIDEYYPERIGIPVVLRSVEVSPEKQTAQIIIYPSVSVNKTRTYKYKLKDIDKSLIDNQLEVTINNNIVDRKEIKATQGTEFSPIMIENLKEGILNITVKESLMKTQTEKVRILIEERYNEPFILSDLKYTVSLGDNNIIVKMVDGSGNKYNSPNLEKIGAFKVMIRTKDGQRTYESGLMQLSTLGDVRLDYFAIEDFIDTDVEVGAVAYYDSNKIGFDSNSAYIGLKNGGILEQYYYILNKEKNLVENSSLMGNIYTKRIIQDPNEFSIENVTDKTYKGNLELQHSDSGLKYQFSTILQTAIEEKNLLCYDKDNNTIKFTQIMPGINLQDENGDYRISTELDRVRFNAGIIKSKKIEIIDNKIYIDLYETDENGTNAKFIKTIEKNVDDFTSQIEIDGLTAKSHYGMKFKAKIKKMDGEIEERYLYLYDVNSKKSAVMYYFSTLSDAGISNINITYAPKKYNDKFIKVEYELGKTMGYDRISYILKKWNSQTKTYEKVDINIEDEKVFNKKMVKEIAINPGSIIKFDTKYQLDIIPLAVTKDSQGVETEIELGRKTQEFTLQKIKMPIIAIKGERQQQEGQSKNIEYRVTIYDEDRAIVDDVYSIKILDKNKSDITPDDLKNKTFDSEIINNAILLKNVDFQKDYTIQVITQLDLDNKHEDFQQFTREYTVHSVNENEISIGKVTALTNEMDAEKIDLRFSQSYKLKDIDKIKYSIYNVSGYTNTNCVEFIPRELTKNGEIYYIFTLDEHITSQGKYYIETQFIKDEKVIEQVTIEYDYI